MFVKATPFDNQITSEKQSNNVLSRKESQIVEETELATITTTTIVTKTLVKANKMDDNDKNEKKTNDTKKEKELSFSNISRIFGSFLLISEIE